MCLLPVSAGSEAKGQAPREESRPPQGGSLCCKSPPGRPHRQEGPQPLPVLSTPQASWIRSWPESHGPPAGLAWGWQLQAQDHQRRTWSPRRGGGTLASLRWEPLRWAWSQLPAALMPPADAPALPTRDKMMWPDSCLATTQVKAARCPPINRQPSSAQ